MKKIRSLLLLCAALAVVAVAVAGLFFYRAVLHGGAGTRSTESASPDMNAAADAERTAPGKTFDNPGAGYALALPADWSVEENSSASVAVHPSPSAGAPVCKVEISAFPPVAEAGRVAWIAAEVGADPTVDVKEGSSEDVSVAGASAVRWTGTMNGAPVTLVYAFTSAYAYEIAPSVIGGPAAASSVDAAISGADPCADALDALTENITFSSQ